MTEPETTIETDNNAEMVFDYQELKSRLSDDVELMQSIVELFLPDMQQQIEQLKLAVSSTDSEKIRSLAHKIKGSAANVGAHALSGEALKIEQEAQNGDIQTCRQQALDNRFAELKTAMEGSLFETANS